MIKSILFCQKRGTFYKESGREAQHQLYWLSSSVAATAAV